MKKLLALLFILSTPAFAIDKPIPCEGASCKLKFETRDGSNVKVSAGEVSGTGSWTLGNATTPTQPHQLKVNANNDAASIRNHNTTAGQSYGLNIVAGTNASDYALKLDNATLTLPLGNVSGVGRWTFSQTGVVAHENDYLSISGLALWRGTAAAATSCDTQCAADDSTLGLNTNSGQCIKSWTASGGVDTCGGTTGTRYCYCTGLQ